MLMFYEKGAWASRFVIFLLIPSWACMLAWHKFLSNQFFRIFSSFLFPWAHWPPFFFLLWSWARWPIGFFTSSFGLSKPIYFTFTFFVPMGLLAIISCHVGPLVFYLFSWTFIAHLLYFCLSLCLWAYWLLLPMMLARWPFTSFVGLPFPLYFYHVSFILFLLHLPSLLEFFFYCWAFCQKQISTSSSLSM